MKRQFKIQPLSPQPARRTDPVPSLVTPGGSTAAKEHMVYTGDQMVGISIIHKSCLQPVFSKQAAEDVAKMRR